MHVIAYVKKSWKETEFSSPARLDYRDPDLSGRGCSERQKNWVSLDRFTHFFDMDHGGYGIPSMPTTLLAQRVEVIPHKPDLFISILDCKAINRLMCTTNLGPSLRHCSSRLEGLRVFEPFNDPVSFETPLR